MNRTFKKRQSDNRRGTVSTEMAICLPILFLLFMGSIDLIRYNLLRNIVSQATYEAARTALVRGSTAQEVRDAADDIISTFDPNLTYDLALTPEPLDDSVDTVTVTLTANLKNNGWIVSKHILGSTMSETMEISND